MTNGHNHGPLDGPGLKCATRSFMDFTPPPNIKSTIKPKIRYGYASRNLTHNSSSRYQTFLRPATKEQKKLDVFHGGTPFTSVEDVKEYLNELETKTKNRVFEFEYTIITEERYVPKRG